MSEAVLFEEAVAALKADAEFPAQAEIRPKKEAEFHVGKSAACVVVAYDAIGPDGTKRTRTHTVWLKRIGTRWEPDRLFPTPDY